MCHRMVSTFLGEQKGRCILLAFFLGIYVLNVGLRSRGRVSEFETQPASTKRDVLLGRNRGPHDEKEHYIDWTDRIFQRKGHDNDPIVIESHKLLFFTIPKNACTTFKLLFRRMMGIQGWKEGNPHNFHKNGLRYLGHYSRAQQEEFLTSPEWTRAVFVRDPLERLVSAYMDKGLTNDQHPEQPEGGYLKKNCCPWYRRDHNEACHTFPVAPYKNSLTEENFPFEYFVTSFMSQCPDRHWKPQILRMHETNWKWINFVGHFENKQEDARRLLETIGAWAEFGASGWGGDNNTLSLFQTNTAKHKTQSKSKMDGYYNQSSEVEALVFQQYQQDYNFELFNLTNSDIWLRWAGR